MQEERTERRQLTILFCDLVGSTALAARCDPEDLRQIVGTFLARCTEVIQRCDGYVARYMGDGVLAYFGYPEASEHDAERAVLAGLGIAAAVRVLPALQGATLRSRVGVATGPVVVGDTLQSGAAYELAAIGETPNLAARLQSMAEADTVLVAEATQRLTSGFFEWMDLGWVTLRGGDRPTRTWRALRERPVVDRFRARHGAQRPASLVDRTEEHDVLVRYWSQAAAGRGAAVLLTGEAGIGKSRLITELRASLPSRSFTALRYFCSPHHQSSALHPLIKQIEHAARLTHTDTPRERLDKLEALLAQTGASMDGALPLIAALLSIDTAGRHKPLDLTAQQLKARTLDVLEEWFCRMAARQPLLAVVEDLHWADPTTRELLGRVVERVRTLPILLLMTSRPETVPSWVNDHNVKSLVLHRLPHSDCLQLTEEIAGARRLPPAVVDRILAHADGVPLFVEELSRTVVLAGAEEEKAEPRVIHGSPTPIRVPETLHDALMARLDRLGRWKEVAQIGALLGRRFSYGMLAAVAPNKDGIAEALQSLVAADIVRCEGVPPDAVFTFKHALLQDVAVANLLRARRQHLHARIARTLESAFPDTALREPELLAWHYMSAGLVEPAVAYCLKAAERALERSANVEAISHLEAGLELLGSLPEGPERDHRELDLVTRLGTALAATRGFGAPEVGAAYTRARRIARRIGEQGRAFPVLRGLWVHNLVRAEWPAAMDFSERMLALGEQCSDPGYLLEGHRALGMTLLWRGELSRAREHFERALQIYRPEEHQRHAILYGNDPGVACLVHEAYVLCVLGYPDRALARAGEAEVLARRLGHPFSVTQSIMYRAFVHQLRQEPDDTLRLAEEALAGKQRFPFWLAEARMLQGWALAERGEIDAGLGAVRRGLAEFDATGALMDRPRWRCALAEVLGKAGQAAEARAAASEALALAQSTGERFYEARLLVLLGEQCLEAADTVRYDDGERYLREALRVARSQNARWWELQAASGLAQHWARQGRVPEAIEVLEPCHAWFQEGSGTADLRRAAALLAELRGAGREV